MTASHDVSSIVRSWIREEEYDSADRVLQIVLSQLDSTPQRRPLWRARRSPIMNTPVRYAIAAAAVLVVALVGYQLLPRMTGPGVETSSPSAPASATASPSASAPPLPAEGAIRAGKYRTSALPTLLVTIPDGWVNVGGFDLRKNLEEPGEVGVHVFATGINVFSDACQSADAETPIGPTAADLLAALRAQKNSSITDPVDVTVAGLPGHRFDISIADDVDITECSIGSLQIWVDATGDYEAGVGLDGAVATVLVADTPTGRLLVVPTHWEESAAADIAERDAIIASMQIVE